MTIELSEYVIDAIADAIVKKMQVPTEEEKALLQKWHDNRGISMKDFEDAMDALEQEPKWIPVLERSPEKSGKYLAYIINKNDDKLQYIMTCEYLVDGYWHWFPDDECASDNVIAWMPLPEPYKPQESEDKE